MTTTGGADGARKAVPATLYSIESDRIMVWMSGKFRQPSSFVTANVGYSEELARFHASDDFAGGCG